MFTPNASAMRHKVVLLDLLQEILKNNLLANNLMFKGGTCAALRDTLDRFSVDLDFDLPDKAQKPVVKAELNKIFKKLNLPIKDQSRNHLQYFLRYDAPENQRNTLKLDVNDVVSKYNSYESVSLLELNIFCNCHTLDTMFANKLVAAKGRFDKTKKLAGRDFFDITAFFKQGMPINTKVVEDLTGQTYKDYIVELLSLVETNLTSQLLYEDLNPLILPKRLKREIPRLKDELLFLLRIHLKDI